MEEQMEVPLETILGQIFSDRSKIQFLRSAYQPGDVEVADALLALSQEDDRDRS